MLNIYCILRCLIYSVSVSVYYDLKNNGTCLYVKNIKICFVRKNIFVFFQFFNEYFSVEYGRFLVFWRQVVVFRRFFGDLKTVTERDLFYVRNDVIRVFRSMYFVCFNLVVNVRNLDIQFQVRKIGFLLFISIYSFDLFGMCVFYDFLIYL